MAAQGFIQISPLEQAVVNLRGCLENAFSEAQRCDKKLEHEFTKSMPAEVCPTVVMRRVDALRAKELPELQRRANDILRRKQKLISSITSLSRQNRAMVEELLDECGLPNSATNDSVVDNFEKLASRCEADERVYSSSDVAKSSAPSTSRGAKQPRRLSAEDVDAENDSIRDNRRATSSASPRRSTSCSPRSEEEVDDEEVDNGGDDYQEEAAVFGVTEEMWESVPKFTRGRAKAPAAHKLYVKIHALYDAQPAGCRERLSVKYLSQNGVKVVGHSAETVLNSLKHLGLIEMTKREIWLPEDYPSNPDASSEQ